MLTMTDNTDIEDIDNTDAEDALFHEELTKYVSQLQPLSPIELAAYNDKIKFMESIHDEIRLTHPLFMPPYLPEDDLDAPFEKGKYLEIVYNVSSNEKSVDNL